MYEQKMSTVVDGVIVVDWSKGPADAQYYTPETDENYEGFMKLDGTSAFCFVPAMGMTKWRLESIRTNEEIIGDKSMIKKENV